MNRIFVKRFGLAALLVCAAGLAAAAPSEARPTRPRRGVSLFAAPTLGFEVNRVYCGLRAIGETCVDITGSPVLGGGSWPRGSGDAYIFNSGLQIAGIVPASAGFAWAGDTVGTWFMDPRGDQQSGEPITDIFSSLNANDLAQWPSAATIRDTALYHSSLIGRQTISQQDIWWRYWDGNPGQTSGRGHPAGILVEQRGLGWNFPSGNEDLVYFIYRFINVTASDASVYAGLVDQGYTPSEIAEIAAIGARFQQQSEARFGVSIPDGGYTISNAFAAFFMDPDVGDFSINYSTAVLPFALSMAYTGDFSEPTWQFPSSIFSPPFAAAPGFVGVKYLKSPENPATGDDFGISMFSNTTNSATFPDAVGIEQVYRYLSGTVSPALGDKSCTQASPQASHLCALVQTADDTRFFMSSGPFEITPGASSVIVVAYLFGAPVAAHVAPRSGEGLRTPPGVPSSGAQFDSGDTVRTVERIAGWVSHTDVNANNVIEQQEVTVVDRSLLQKALVAQAVFDNKFLLPFAPEAPRYYTIPGDNQVIVVWQASPSETTGDPYFEVASDPFVRDDLGNPTGPNPLYDPNYRQFDVEGYRIWRGRTPSQMEVIAQFDYGDRPFIDSTLTLFNVSYGTQCAPELGLTTSCPAAGNPVPISTQTGLQPGLVQIAPGGRVVTTGGNVVITQADTAVSGGLQCNGVACPNLLDTGVPFSFIDDDVRNGFQYFYAVTAFDVNSVKSVGVGNTSLESPLVTRPVTPRAGSGQEVAGTISPIEFVDASGAVINIPTPTLDAATGQFSGPQPPADLELGFSAFIPQIVDSGALNVRVDSLRANSFVNEGEVGGNYYMTVQGAGAAREIVVPASVQFHSDEHVITAGFEATATSTARSARFGGDSTFSLFGQVQFTLPGSYRLQSWGRSNANADPAASQLNGPRWWTGATNENTADPVGNKCLTIGPCGNSLTRTAGALAGVSTLWHIEGYGVVGTQPARQIQAVNAFYTRAADIRVTWGAAGAVTEVFDLTHGIPVPFDTQPNASWGILNASGMAGVTQPDGDATIMTWTDHQCMQPYKLLITTGSCGGAAGTPANLENTAVLNPIRSTTTGGAAGAPTGTGFLFYLNGHWFVMEMAALPTAGTVWFYRSYSGAITGLPGSFAFEGSPRPPAAPGLRARINFTPSSFDPSTTTAANLARVHTVPDPYYVTNALEITATTKILKFVNLPAQAIVRIYSTSGVLINIVNHNDVTGGGEATWNLRNRNNQFVASGVYFYHVETPDGQEKIGRFTVVNFAQ